MQDKVPDLAGQVAGDAGKAVGAAIGLGAEGLLATLEVGKVGANVPGKVASDLMGALQEVIRIANHYVQHGESPR